MTKSRSMLLIKLSLHKIKKYVLKNTIIEKSTPIISVQMEEFSETNHTCNQS